MAPGLVLTLVCLIFPAFEGFSTISGRLSPRDSKVVTSFLLGRRRLAVFFPVFWMRLTKAECLIIRLSFLVFEKPVSIVERLEVEVLGIDSVLFALDFERIEGRFLSAVDACLKLAEVFWIMLQHHYHCPNTFYKNALVYSHYLYRYIKSYGVV